MVMTEIKFIHSYQHIISTENLLEAWREFVNGKRSRKDVQIFERNLMENILSLHWDLPLVLRLFPFFLTVAEGLPL